MLVAELLAPDFIRLRKLVLGRVEPFDLLKCNSHADQDRRCLRAAQARSPLGSVPMRTCARAHLILQIFWVLRMSGFLFFFGLGLGSRVRVWTSERGCGLGIALRTVNIFTNTHNIIVI